MRDHDRRVDRAGAHQAQGILQILRVAARRADHVVAHVVHIVEVHPGGEVGLRGAREEVEAAVEPEQRGGLLDQRGDRREDEDVVEALAARRQRPQGGGGGGEGGGVDVVQRDAARGGIRRREDRGGAVEASLVDVGDDEHRGPVRVVQGQVDRTEAHRAGAREHRHRSAGPQAHPVDVGAGGVVVVGLEGADDAGDRFGQRGLEAGVALVGQQAVELHHLAGNDDARGMPADVAVGVAGGHVLASRQAQRGLDGELLAGLEARAPRPAHLDQPPAELVAEDDGVGRAVVRHALVPATLLRRLVVRHADAVGDDLRQNLVIGNPGQLEALEPQVVLAIESQRQRLHEKSL